MKVKYLFRIINENHKKLLQSTRNAFIEILYDCNQPSFPT